MIGLLNEEQLDSWNEIISQYPDVLPNEMGFSFDEHEDQGTFYVELDNGHSFKLQPDGELIKTR